MAGSKVLVRAVVIDFDGTICPQDVSEEILQAFALPEWWDIDLEFRPLHPAWFGGPLVKLALELGLRRALSKLDHLLT